MNEEAFVKKREPAWQQLFSLCDRGEASLANLKPQELADFIRLYRQASADLALARTHSSNLQLIDFLNDLTARCYSLLYRPPRGSVWKAFGQGVLAAAQTARRAKNFIIASALILFGSGILAAVLLEVQPETRSYLVQPEFDELSKHWQEGNHTERSGSEGVLYTAAYAANNPFVAVLAASFAAATFGVGTTIILFNNGVILGVLSSDMAKAGKLGFLYASITPHGVTEISGMVFSGAAGLMMGWAMINPGRRRRGEALVEAGRDAVTLLAISVVLMFMAAPIEGFFSFNPSVPTPVKVIFALATAVAWAMFWVGYGREKDAVPLAEPQP